jgi:hypothetical protein
LLKLVPQLPLQVVWLSLQQLLPQLKLQLYPVAWYPDGQPIPHLLYWLQPLQPVQSPDHWQELVQLFDWQVPQPDVVVAPGEQIP